MLSVSEIKNIAALARIGIEDKDIPQYQCDLSAILDHFKKLEKLPTETIDPINHITGLENVDRSDLVVEFEDSESILKNAPERKDGYVKVKSVF